MVVGSVVHSVLEATGSDMSGLAVDLVSDWGIEQTLFS